MLCWHLWKRQGGTRVMASMLGHHEYLYQVYWQSIYYTIDDISVNAIRLLDKKSGDFNRQWALSSLSQFGPVVELY